jgi:hypothetical protein
LFDFRGGFKVIVSVDFNVIDLFLSRFPSSFVPTICICIPFK